MAAEQGKAETWISVEGPSPRGVLLSTNDYRPVVPDEWLDELQGKFPVISTAYRTKACRSGKWSEEEVAFAHVVISHFAAGLLNLRMHTTLRSVLSAALRCQPMRVSKKFPKASSLGKKLFLPAVDPNPGFSTLEEEVGHADAQRKKAFAAFMASLDPNGAPAKPVPNTRDRKRPRAAAARGQPETYAAPQAEYHPPAPYRPPTSAPQYGPPAHQGYQPASAWPRAPLPEAHMRAGQYGYPPPPSFHMGYYPPPQSHWPPTAHHYPQQQGAGRGAHLGSMAVSPHVARALAKQLLPILRQDTRGPPPPVAQPSDGAPLPPHLAGPSSAQLAAQLTAALVGTAGPRVAGTSPHSQGSVQAGAWGQARPGRVDLDELLEQGGPAALAALANEVGALGPPHPKRRAMGPYSSAGLDSLSLAATQSAAISAIGAPTV